MSVNSLSRHGRDDGTADTCNLKYHLQNRKQNEDKRPYKSSVNTIKVKAMYNDVQFQKMPRLVIGNCGGEGGGGG